MSGHRKFRDLVAKIEADPVRVVRSEGYTRAIKDALALGALREMREQRGVTQAAVADSLGTSQANVSRFEHEKDTYLSSLAGYVAALGGRLEISAVFPDQRIQLITPDENRAVPAEHTPAMQSGRVGESDQLDNVRRLGSVCDAENRNLPHGN